MRNDRDGYGESMLAAYKTPGHAVIEIIERDDGYIDAARTGPPRYFSDYAAWSKRERQAIRMARGRILDVGCGAGRFALHLQHKGLEVMAIDNSPGAIKVSKLRGVRKAMLRSIAEIGMFRQGSFDTVIMMGNNFGLFGGRQRAKRLLQSFYRVTSDQGQIIAEATDPYTTAEPVHLEYLKFNRSRGRMSGQLRLRVRYGKAIGPWFDYLFVSQKEMKEILRGTGWEIRKVFSEGGPGYIAVLAKCS